MRVQHNIMAMNSYRNYNNNTRAISKNLEKLSSGYRVNRAGDDAAGLAISEKMRAQITGLKTAQKNAKDGISVIQTAEGALTEVHSMLNRMFELAEQSCNGIYSDKVDREALDDEFQALKSEVDRISKATNFNGTTLLNGDLGATGGDPMKLQIGDTQDVFNQLTIGISDMSAEGLELSDGTTAPSATNANISTYSYAGIAMTAVKTAINTVSTQRGSLGALQNRLEHTINNLSVMTENITDAESTIRDTDVAEEMMAYTKNNILIQASQAMLAQANQIPQGVLQLMG